MPSGSIPHDKQRPDDEECHEECHDESYERALIRATAAPFIVFPSAALLDRRMTHIQREVLMAMCWHANKKHLVWCKQETIAAELNMPRPMVTRNIRALIALGYVEIVRKAFRGSEIAALRTNKYRIIWDAPGEIDDDPDIQFAHRYLTDTSIGISQIHHRYLTDTQNSTIEQYQSSRNREDVDDDEETRVPARPALAENIISAGDLPRQTNRAALAQLIANHPQISDGEWTFQAAAAAAWYAEHDRRMNLANFGSWITRYLRERQQLASAASATAETIKQEQEQPHGRSSQHRGSRGARRTPAQPGHISADLRYPAGRDDTTDDLIPPGANEEELIEYYRRANSERRRAEQAEREARLN